MAELKNILAELPDPLPVPGWYARNFQGRAWETLAPLQQMLVIQLFGVSGEREWIKAATARKTSSWRDLIESVFSADDDLGESLLRRLDKRSIEGRGGK